MNQVYLVNPTTSKSTAIDPPSVEALAAMGPRERYVWENAIRIHTSVTESHLSHARHTDGCASCQGDEDLADQRSQQADRDDREATFWRFNIHRLVADVGERPETTVAEVVAALEKLGRAADRIRKKR